MFKGLGGLGDMAKMMKAAQEMQSKMGQLQDDLASLTVTGESGAGLVTATATAKGELVGLSIDESIFVPSEKEVAKMMASVDENSDGVVDFAEFSEIHRQALDGSLEFRALADAMTSFDALTAQMDDDDDSDAAPDAGAG